MIYFEQITNKEEKKRETRRPAVINLDADRMKIQKQLTCIMTDVVVLGLTVKMQMLCNVLFNIISYSFSNFPKYMKKFFIIH